LRVPQLFDRIVQYVDRVKILTGFYRPTLGFVQLNERDQDLELVTLLGAFGRTPASLDFC
jgi:hypothetical protein